MFSTAHVFLPESKQAHLPEFTVVKGQQKSRNSLLHEYFTQIESMNQSNKKLKNVNDQKKQLRLKNYTKVNKELSRNSIGKSMSMNNLTISNTKLSMPLIRR